MNRPRTRDLRSAPIRGRSPPGERGGELGEQIGGANWLLEERPVQPELGVPAGLEIAATGSIGLVEEDVRCRDRQPAPSGIASRTLTTEVHAISEDVARASQDSSETAAETSRAAAEARASAEAGERAVAEVDQVTGEDDMALATSAIEFATGSTERDFFSASPWT